MLRLRDGWHAVKTATPQSDDPQRLATICLQHGRRGESEGHSFTDFSFGDIARFRAMAFGFPNTTVLMISRMEESPPGSAVAQPNGIGPRHL
jgi:hypothetical protein